MVSPLRKRAAKVKEDGVRTRKTWAPGGVDLRIYLWWSRTTGKKPQQENFCHYWRVVLLWAPLRFLRYVLTGMVAAIVGLGLAWLVVHFAHTVLQALLVIGIIIGSVAYLFLSARTFGQLLQQYSRGKSESEWPWLIRQRRWVRAGIIAFTAPVSLALTIFMGILYCIFNAFEYLHEDHDVFRKIGRALGKLLFGLHFSDRASLTWIRLWLVGPIAIVVLAFWYEWALAATIWMGIIVTVLSFIVLVSWQADRLSEKRKAQQAKQQAARQIAREAHHRKVDEYLELLAQRLHPQVVIDSDDELGELAVEANAWISGYNSHCYILHEMSRDNAPDSILMAYVHSRLEGDVEAYQLARELYQQVFGKPAPALPGEATTHIAARKLRWVRTRAALRGALDLGSLLWAAVVTTKWQICPIVVIPGISGKPTVDAMTD